MVTSRENCPSYCYEAQCTPLNPITPPSNLSVGEPDSHVSNRQGVTLGDTEVNFLLHLGSKVLRSTSNSHSSLVNCMYRTEEVECSYMHGPAIKKWLQYLEVTIFILSSFFYSEITQLNKVCGIVATCTCA